MMQQQEATLLCLSCRVLHRHRREVLPCRLKGEEAEFLMNCFKEFWAAQDWEAAAHAPETPGTDEATSARHDTLPADSSASAEEHLSSAKAGGGAAHSNCRAADTRDLNQHGTTRAANVAADAAEGTDGKRAANQGRCRLHPSVQHSSVLKASAVFLSGQKQDPDCLLPLPSCGRYFPSGPP